MPPCDEHSKIIDVLHRLDASLPLLQKDIEYLRRDQETILARFGKHVDDADRDGGWHSRVVELENDVKNAETQRRNDLIISRWFMLGAGVLGGGIVSGSIRIWGVLSKILGA